MALLIAAVLSLMLLSSPDGSWGLNVVRVDVPSAVGVGGDHLLHCVYDLNGTSLYALRWYKDNKEFFRYMPREAPAKRSFNIPGVNVDMTQSTAKLLWLIDVTKPTSGVYRCEVSGESPAFETDTKDAHFNVLEAPKGKPFITSSFITPNGNVIGLNESLTANCSGPSGQPPPDLTWTLGGIQIEEKYTTRRRFRTDDLNESYKSMLDLPMSWVKHREYTVHTGGGRADQTTLKLRCVSRLHGLFEDSDTVELHWRQEAEEGAADDAGDADDASFYAVNSRPSGKIATLHGALTNAVVSTAPSLFLINLLLSGFLVSASTNALLFCSEWWPKRSSTKLQN